MVEQPLIGRVEPGSLVPRLEGVGLEMPTKRRLKPRQIGFQFGCTLLNLILGQIEIGRWPHIAYNGDGHGFFFFFSARESLKIPCLGTRYRLSTPTLRCNTSRTFA